MFLSYVCYLQGALIWMSCKQFNALPKSVTFFTDERKYLFDPSKKEKRPHFNYGTLENRIIDLLEAATKIFPLRSICEAIQVK